MFAKLVDFSELSKLLSVKSKMSVDFVPIRSFWPSWVAKALPLSLLDDKVDGFRDPFEYDERKSRARLSSRARIIEPMATTKCPASSISRPRSYESLKKNWRKK